MLVILRENVENLGRIGDMVRVSDGYARNFLIPRKLVAIADEANQKQIENQKKQLAKKRQALRAVSSEVAEKLAAIQCTIHRKVGENDKIFGSVTSSDIAQALKALGFKIEKKWITLESPIRALGVHEAIVKLDSDVTAKLKVWVVKE